MLRGIHKPISLEGAKCSIESGMVKLAGKHGTSELSCPDFINCELKDGSINIVMKELGELSKTQKALAGTFKANLVSWIKGVQHNHEKTVIFTGTGSSVKVVQSNNDPKLKGLSMRLGKSHIVEKDIPEGITCTVVSADIRETRLQVTGISAAMVGQFAAELCIKNPYKGGIHAWIAGKEIPLRGGKSG